MSPSTPSRPPEEAVDSFLERGLGTGELFSLARSGFSALELLLLGG